ncbi:N-acetylglucosamine-6-phosphate deacetylase [Salipiger mangrovisoli]|uniref:N-acetylglucosamine-6-phosphate deacetylase n=1 Tax=Salipiger mangrovisoli TaxID=2865933 RepID=A0ABR9XAT3_9RHOB|nr:N-acetylglucosamine-6-phosphate deacetylase [Salipiger mangrovisoli]MBE9640591.1 N-acetylglucosamine-6-phosphate deacetylase [Salipiger mangrovisoli]
MSTASLLSSIRQRSGPIDLPVVLAAGTEGAADHPGRTVRLLPDGRLLDHGPLASQPENFTTPGLVDLQVNGFAGVDFNRPGVTPAELDHALVALARTGVTTVLPTVITGAAEQMLATLSSLDAAVQGSRLGPEMVAGYHIEGPFLSTLEGFRGAHDAAHMGPAEIGLIDRLQAAATRPIRLVTLAPEVCGALELTRELVRRGIRVAVGHSAATPDQLAAAVEAGARLATHLGNGLPQQLPKFENPVFWQLAQDGLAAMFIADGIHIPPGALRSLLRAKGLEHSLLVTDAVSAAGPDQAAGLYPFGAETVERAADGTVRVPGAPNLAGSSAEMAAMLRNVMIWAGLPLAEALRLCQLNPLRCLEPEWRFGTDLAQARLVEWKMTDAGPQVRRTHIGPHTVQ